VARIADATSPEHIIEFRPELVVLLAHIDACNDPRLRARFVEREIGIGD
jgi:hypothetical protein